MKVWVLLVNDGEAGEVQGVFTTPELAYDKFSKAVACAGVPTDANSYDGSHLIVNIGPYEKVGCSCGTWSRRLRSDPEPRAGRRALRAAAAPLRH